MNHLEAKAAWLSDKSSLEARGVILPGAQSYIADGWKADRTLALDAAPTLFTDPNAGLPSVLTTLVDPDVIRVIFTPNRAAEIWGEQKKGSWTTRTMEFSVVEQTGEVSSYGDYNESGRAGLNLSFVFRQNYLYQAIVEVGDLEQDMAGLANIAYASEVEQSAATVMNKFANMSYHYGIAGLQNYGCINDPGLPAPITPSTKAAGGVKWTTNGVITATANEVYTDVQSMYLQLNKQTQGNVKMDDRMKLIASPDTAVALTATNSFNVSVMDLLKKNFPNLTIEQDPLYGAYSSMNPQGIMAGNLVQLIAETVDGQKVGYVAFSEKLRSHPVVRAVSSWKKKVTGGTFGAIIRYPLGVAQMIGV